MNPKHEAHGNSVYVGRVEVAKFNDPYQAACFAKFANEPRKITEEEKNEPSTI